MLEHKSLDVNFNSSFAHGGRALVLFYSRPPSPGSRQRNSRAEVIRSVSLGNWEWRALLQPWPTGLPGEDGACKHCLSLFSVENWEAWLCTALRFHCQVNSEGVWSWIKWRSFWGGVYRFQMSPDIPILCLISAAQSVQLGMAEPWYP